MRTEDQRAVKPDCVRARQERVPPGTRFPRGHTTHRDTHYEYPPPPPPPESGELESAVMSPRSRATVKVWLAPRKAPARGNSGQGGGSHGRGKPAPRPRGITGVADLVGPEALEADQRWLRRWKSSSEMPPIGSIVAACCRRGPSHVVPLPSLSVRRMLTERRSTRERHGAGSPLSTSFLTL